MTNVEVDDNTRDDHVDAKISECFSLGEGDKKPRSFFLYADAGSGKTRSLVKALFGIRDRYGGSLKLHGRKVAVITYTNAACDEIRSRLGYDGLFFVSTIHSFIWDLIRPYQKNIREWLKTHLSEEIAELTGQQEKGKSGTKIAASRAKSIADKAKRLEALQHIKVVTYNPNGENVGRDSLNHSEVIAMGASFIKSKSLLQKVFIDLYPILLIDESQDTNGALMEAFMNLQDSYKDSFTLGLFGDTMQRIYQDGKADLDKAVPVDWVRPAKIMNHRCPKRVVTLINRIRSFTDGHVQSPRGDKVDGFARLFLCDPAGDKDAIESAVSQRMTAITEDPNWGERAKRLILEHRMAAKRLGFLELHDALAPIGGTGYMDGSMPGMRLLTELILPLVAANRRGDKGSLARVVKKHSPLVKIDRSSHDQMKAIARAREATGSLLSLWANGSDPACSAVLKSISDTGLFEIPSPLSIIVARRAGEPNTLGEVSKKDQPIVGVDAEMTGIAAWDAALQIPFSQVEAYYRYTSGASRFGTHQGVKGLEFPHVMAIIDDEEAKGFLFSYDKIFGTKPSTKTDLQNEADGKDTSIKRTLRLFYVICSRALESLAVVLYTEDPETARACMRKNDWFAEHEIETI